jgi:hypothetical protein
LVSYKLWKSETSQNNNLYVDKIVQS